MSYTNPVRPLFRGLHLLCFLLLLPCSPLYGQKVGEWVRFAKEAKEEGDHLEAVEHLRKALEEAPERTDIRYELAHSLRKSHLYEDALEAYKQVQEADRRGERFPDCLLWIAEMQEHMGNYREAKRAWGELKRRYIRDKDRYLYRRADQGSRSCEWAREAIEEPSDLEVEREAFPINTKGSEFAPYIHQDSLLFFTVLRAEEEHQDGSIEGPAPKARIVKAASVTRVSDEDSSQAEMDAPTRTEWGEPRTLQGPWDEELHRANTTFADSGRTILFSSCKERNGEKACRIVRSRKKEGEWGEAKPLPQRINPDSSNTTHPMIGQYRGQEVLFFSSDRPQGHGKMDIWWVPRKGLDDYGELKNAGDSINSPDNEVTPFYLRAERKLYFASDWHHGFGGYDILWSRLEKDGAKEPVNPGHPVNSSYDDLYPYLDVERNKGFFASNREDSREGWVGMCCHDIYQWPISIEPRTDTLEVASVEDLNRFLPVTLYFHNDRPDPSTMDTTTEIAYDESYRDYKERVPKYIDTYAEGRSERMKDTAKDRMKRFFDERVDGGMQDLRVFSDLLLKELKKGQDIELTIKGYASPLANTEYNVHLTKRRIASLIKFLRAYEDGVYRNYLENEAEDGGSLSFLLKPYGEYSADSLVSDELEDKQRSVYSVSAALERKIEIERVKQVREDTSYAELVFAKGVHDLGKVRADSTYTFDMSFRNEGKDTLAIDSVTSGSEALEVEAKKERLAPGDGGRIHIRLTPDEKKGKQLEKFVVYSNGISRKREASITYEGSDQR